MKYGKEKQVSMMGGGALTDLGEKRYDINVFREEGGGELILFLQSR